MKKKILEDIHSGEGVAPPRRSAPLFWSGAGLFVVTVGLAGFFLGIVFFEESPLQIVGSPLILFCGIRVFLYGGKSYRLDGSENLKQRRWMRGEHLSLSITPVDSVFLCASGLFLLTLRTANISVVLTLFAVLVVISATWSLAYHGDPTRSIVETYQRYFLDV